ncbi:MAG: radical SAM family heme chaperone HemW [Acidimicrobiales bacterium]|nr:radical SAM family heme chaperone HemW [Acidimicrobiales bacterium]
MPRAEPSRLELPPGAFGVYVHIPFCTRRCDYCAFATWDDRADRIGPYLDAVEAEIAGAVADGLPPATSVFFGGGTPSLLNGEDLTRLLAAIPRAAGAEVTVECNPETLDANKLAAYRAGGVTRISLGVQSMVPSVLAALGRVHEPTVVQRSVALARAADFGNINIDLIYGAAGESLAAWRHTIDEVLKLEPSHISAYALTVEPGTPLAADRGRHPDDDDQADKYLLAAEVLEAAGYEWYEVSNWARPGYECQHNLLYWLQGAYRGFGCAAHSHLAGRRWWNVHHVDRYIAALQAGRSPEAGHEQLGPDERRIEALQLELRTARGVPADALDLSGLGDPLEGRVPCALPGTRALLEPVGGRVVLTRHGRLLANEIALRLR